MASRRKIMDEFGINSGYVAELLDRYLGNPESVDESWQTYFRSRLPAGSVPKSNGNGATNGRATAAGDVVAPAKAPPLAPAPMTLSPAALSMVEVQGRVAQLINAYRVRGHLFARVDPLRLEPVAPPQLELANFELSEADLDRTFSTVDMAGPKSATLRE